MKVLYIHQYFKTPSEPGGTRSYWISRELVNRGHQVVVITSTNKNHPNPGRVIIDGIEVIYIKNEYNNYMSKLQKINSFVKYMIKSIRLAKCEKDVDVVFATSTPLTVGYVALRLKSIKKWKYVFEVRDLWPEFPIQIGAIRNKFIIKLLRQFEKKIYFNSEYVVALSPGMKEGVVQTGFPEKKCFMIPNMAKPDKFFPREKNSDIANEFGIDLNKFNVIHFGSMGVANGLSYIIEAAKVLSEKNISDVNFIFMGFGATEPKLKELVNIYKLNNVKFLGNHKMDIVSEVVNCCDASITTFKNLPILQTNSPNKLFDSLSAGKPIIVNSAGWTKDLCEKENCGFFADPENPTDLANKLINIKDNHELLNQWSKNARNLSINVFDKNILAAKVADVIEKVH